MASRRSELWAEDVVLKGRRIRHTRIMDFGKIRAYRRPSSTPPVAGIWCLGDRCGHPRFILSPARTGPTRQRHWAKALKGRPRSYGMAVPHSVGRHTHKHTHSAGASWAARRRQKVDWALFGRFGKIIFFFDMSHHF
ncbi:unnamed protein product [Protopolystoma xenopodis]|uniref:Uncharacterized protein n=1 Tax=Protopolystoma xenopodis TaxID=117903 RepID=A0A448WPN4_9PLAT|nr:unnamed protein product [Protopolystoma xenopodis]